MTPSPQQQAVVNWAKTDTGSLNLIAFAGTGKTSTLVNFLLPALTGTVFLGAFNRAIAEELKTRIGFRPGTTVQTMHALGMSLFRRINNKFRVEGRKVRTIGKTYFPTNMPQDKACLTVLCDAVSYAKQTGFGLVGTNDYTDVSAWRDLADYYDLWDELPPTVTQDEMINTCISVYKKSLDQCVTDKDSIIDFDDMILAPLYFGDKSPMFDWVLIDELQDSNHVRRQLALNVLRPGGRLVGVGDKFQSVYGFCGATNDAMDVLRDILGSKELPLSVTYRCPKKVVELAQTWVPDITAHESAPDGEVLNITHREFLRYDFNSTDAILCRNTRPLIGIAKYLRSRGIACVVEGANYRGLMSLCSKWGEEIPVSRMLDKLAAYTNDEAEKWMLKGNEEKAEQVREKLEMIYDFAEGMDQGSPVHRLLDRIDAMLSYTDDDRDILRLSTVHRSKGKEFDRVFLVGRSTYMPSKWAKQDWEFEQERNLMYVAVTRAKRVLVEVDVPVKKKGEGEWWEV